MRPLADEIRPQTLDDVAGQKHLLGEGALLRRLIENGTDANLIFYGPSGTGKTTVANIIAKQAKKALYTLNATTASLQDVKNVMADVDTMMAPNGILLYLDEIQYFNKKQQQSLLEFLENGKITLIASTTENPYFYIYNALLSRSTVFEFKPLSVEDTIPAVERGLRIEQERSQLPFTWEEDVPRTVAAGCGGDVRKAINAVELLYRSAKPKDGGLYVTRDDALQLSQCSAMRYDRAGDDHYDLLSALHKSIRGSDPDAAVYYLGRLLVAGDLISPCRRLLFSATLRPCATGYALCARRRYVALPVYSAARDCAGCRDAAAAETQGQFLEPDLPRQRRPHVREEDRFQFYRRTELFQRGERGDRRAGVGTLPRGSHRFADASVGRVVLRQLLVVGLLYVRRERQHALQPQPLAGDLRGVVRFEAARILGHRL